MQCIRYSKNVNDDDIGGVCIQRIYYSYYHLVYVEKKSLNKWKSLRHDFYINY